MNTLEKISNTELQQESLNTTDKQVYSSEDVECRDVEDTPFVINRKDNKWYLMIKNYRLSEGYDDAEEATKAGKEITWNRITQLMCIMINEQELIITKTKE